MVRVLRPRSLVIGAVGLFVICLGLAVWAVAIEPGEAGGAERPRHPLTVEEEGRHLFVTSGIATSIIPVRFLVPPEIVIARLKGKG